MLELKIAGAVEVVVLTPNAEVVTLETAGVDALFAKLNPVPKEAAEALLPTPNPVKDDTTLAEEAAGVTEALAATEDAAVAPKAGTEGDKAVLPVATVEAVVVVTVENSGDKDVVNEKDPAGFEAGVEEAEEAEAEAEAEAEEPEVEAALENPKEG